MLQKIPLKLEYQWDGTTVRQVVLPLDVVTRGGAEWLKFEMLDGGEVREIRLDAIGAFSETARA